MRYPPTHCIARLVLAFGLWLPLLAGAQSATEIVTRADAHLRGASSEAEMSMQIVRPNWQRTIRMKSWALGTAYSMILISEPARDRGTVFLKRENEIWHWVPSIGRTVRMPPSMMAQSWMGSDFTNDDLVRESSIVHDYTHALVRSEPLQGETCYVIDLMPRPNAAVVWGRVRMWITQRDYLQLRTELYDEDDELVQIIEGSNIRTFDGRRLPARMTLIPQDRRGHQTVLEYHSLSFSTNLTPAFFTQHNMRRVQ